MNHLRAMLVEYSLSIPPLAIAFEFNPQTLTRSRAVTLPESRPGGADFTTPLETPRASLGVTVQPETLSIEVLLDGSELPDGMAAFGIQPALDVLRSLVEPKVQGPDGLRTLAKLGQAPGHAFQRDESASVVLFVWGTHMLPVFLTSVRVEELHHNPMLVPLRAKVTVQMQVIESDNPFTTAETIRQVVGAAMHLPVAAATGGTT